jgi:hypothetical protein
MFNEIQRRMLFSKSAVWERDEREMKHDAVLNFETHYEISQARPM